MILYQCICGSTFTAGKTFTRKGKDGKKKHTYMGSEEERKAKREWKDKHGTHKGCYQNLVELNNRGHGYVRYQLRKN